MLIGSIVNVAAILAGSTVGLLLRWGIRRFSALFSAGSGQLGERLQSIIMQGLALCTTCMGISGSLKGQNSLIMILSMVIGGLIGELLDLDAHTGGYNLQIAFSTGALAGRSAAEAVR